MKIRIKTYDAFTTDKTFYIQIKEDDNTSGIPLIKSYPSYEAAYDFIKKNFINYEFEGLFQYDYKTGTYVEHKVDVVQTSLPEVVQVAKPKTEAGIVQVSPPPFFNNHRRVPDKDNSVKAMPVIRVHFHPMGIKGHIEPCFYGVRKPPLSRPVVITKIHYSLDEAIDEINGKFEKFEYEGVFLNGYTKIKPSLIKDHLPLIPKIIKVPRPSMYEEI